MQRRSTLLSFVAIAATALVVAMGGAAYADDVIVDGDTLTTNVVDSSINLGTVACGATTTRQVAIWLHRNGNGQVFASGATIAVSADSSNTALSAAPVNITIPSGWDASGSNNSGADTTKVTTQLSLTSSTAGTASSVVTFSALGRKSAGDSTKPVTSTLNVSWTVASCVVKTDTTTTVTCPTSSPYTGSRVEPCSAAVKDSGGGTIATPTVTYSGGHTNVSDSPVTASASYSGDSTHNSSSGSATFSITRAPSTTTVTCPTSAVYSGSPLTPCTATVTGVGGLNAGVSPVSYTNNTNVGTAQASATYAGDANHTSSTGNGSFAITGAAATCSVSGYTGVFDGGAHRATGTCTGLGGIDLTSGLDLGASFTDVPGGTANWSFSAPDYLGQTGSAAIAIGQATSSVALTCSDTVYTGSAQETCHATVTGAGGLSKDVDVSYASNTDAGTATATADFAGDVDHTGSTAQTTFTIAKAPSTTTISCALPVTYTGAALTPCSATATGAGTLTGSAQLSYADNTGAGTASVSAHYPGDANHDSSDDKTTFAIGKAGSSIALSCPTSVVYSAAAQTPCTATASAVGLDDFTVTVAYGANTDAGDATATATWAGDANHDGTTAEGGFHIDQAASETTVDCPTTGQAFTGSAIEPCTAKVTGPGLDHGVDVTYDAKVHPGMVHASASFAGDANHLASAGGSQFDIVKASTSITITCGSATYDGSAHSPCTATVTSPSDLSLGADVTSSLGYSDNVNAGTASVNASYAGDGDHEGSTADTTFSIGKASSSISFSCDPVSYTGQPLTPCAATATGAGNLIAAVTGLAYTDNTNAGDNTAGVSGSYAGDVNHDGSTGSTTFTIGKASSSISFSCDPVTYTGQPLTPCTADAVGAGGLEAPLTELTYTDNTDAGVGTAGVSGSYAGDANHDGSSGSDTFTIGKASSSISFSCDRVTYTGQPLAPCSAVATGAGDLKAAVTGLAYTNNTNAGVDTAGVSGEYAGDANHDGSEGSSTFTIDKASSTLVFTCAPAIYTGSAVTPCTATPVGAGGPGGAVDLTYTNNINAGDNTAGVNGSYQGDDNHTGTTGSTTFSIDKAPSSIAFACASVTYTGLPLTPCTAAATGAGMQDVDLTGSLVYSDNVNAGTAHVSASYGGDSNHTAAAPGTTGFTIGKASSSVTLTCPSSVLFSGSPITPCTAVATGINLNQPVTPITYGSNTAVGSATASATFVGDVNHEGSYQSGGFQITGWTALGFYKPVDGNGVINVVKGGSTVPLKFNAYAGPAEITDTATLKGNFIVKGGECTANALVSDDLITTTGGTSLRYDTSGHQWVQNWQVPSGAGKCYKVVLTIADGSQLSALFKTK